MFLVGGSRQPLIGTSVDRFQPYFSRDGFDLVSVVCELDFDAVSFAVEELVQGVSVDDFVDRRQISGVNGFGGCDGLDDYFYRGFVGVYAVCGRVVHNSTD